MLSFLLAVVFTVLLYLMMRAFPKYQVDTTQAVVFNYYSCVVLGLFLLPKSSDYFGLSWQTPTTLLTLVLGAMFVVVFLLIGLTTTRVSVTAASLAGNMSLVIPVLFGLFVFKNNHKDFTLWNYLGLFTAIIALALSTIRSSSGEVVSNAKKGLVLVLPLLLFVCSGTNNTLINYISGTYYRPDESVLFTTIACTGAVVIGTSFLVFRMILQQEKIKLQSILGGFLLGIPNFLSFYFLLAALRAFDNSAAFVFPIYNVLSMLTSAFMAWVLFKEQLNSFNKLGLFLAILAIFLISYQEILEF
ncbi:MAG: EamA family transporter [Runella sp.]